MHNNTYPKDNETAAVRGEPSYVWRAGQERRLTMIKEYGDESIHGKLLVNGCGLGQYLSRLAENAELAIGLDIELPRLIEAIANNKNLVCAEGEHLPFSLDTFTSVLSNEVIEHVNDDRQAVKEIARTLKKNGRFILFCPNRGYPFETHGIYWRGEYSFGNKLLINYLPRSIRDRLAPHVRVYSRNDLKELISQLPFLIEYRTTIFGAYDNIIKKMPTLGKILRSVLYFLEKTSFNRLGLSHFWVMRKH